MCQNNRQHLLTSSSRELFFKFQDVIQEAITLVADLAQVLDFGSYALLAQFTILPLEPVQWLVDSQYKTYH